MLRGEIQPTGTTGALYIRDIPVTTDRYRACFHLGACPQFDAIDTLSVRQHLIFYARIRGISRADVPTTVDAMIRSVGLRPFADRMADTLSGGNKRKLSLAMALIGDPEVVLLDEPSSGMDAVAKRNMWMTLAKFRPGRSILLTTHSMEEADALADRVGVISRRLLDVGSTQALRHKYGDGFHVHVVLASAPGSSDDEMKWVQEWVECTVPGAKIEGIPYHGQLRFSISTKKASNRNRVAMRAAEDYDGEQIRSSLATSNPNEVVSAGSLFTLLEENKQSQGIEFYSVSPTTFDEVFLKVVERHNVEEEDVSVQKSLLRRIFAFG